ncbi:glycosyltransferase N-terminal domain-containing protein [Neisseria sp. P0013.S004]|uniref:glycosyltransferase N-terminal domain-containing protein n=1 Tax=Neisseria sp. P0013.S004 TaxID=3436740 RepID=UPI003F7E294E
MCAVFVGEARAAESLVYVLRRHFPGLPFLITQMTPTGRAIAQFLFPGAQCRCLPYDESGWVVRFVAGRCPICGILVGVGVWFGLVCGCGGVGVLFFLVDVRFSGEF